MRNLILVFFLVINFSTFLPTATALVTDITQNQLVLQATPAPIPTSTPGLPVPTRTGPPLSLTLILLGMCCVFVLFIGVVVLGFVARNPKKKEENNSNL